MKQERFEALHQAEWEAFENWLGHHLRIIKHQDGTVYQPPFANHEMPQRYRNLCQHLAIARDRGYSLLLVERLHNLVQSGHDILYRANSGISGRMLNYLAGGFAADLRANLRWVLLSSLLIIGPWIVMMAVIRLWPDFIYVVIAPDDIHQMDEMYNGDDAFDYGASILRDSGSNWKMFGFYIYNNISIAFRAFAGGLLAGLGTVYTLVFNGIHMGAIEARLVNIGAGRNFYSFVLGHTAFEIGGIIISGASGLKLGWSLIMPGRLSRPDSLKTTARSVLGLICGSGIMLLIAAMIEAFWSPHNFPLPIKIAGGVITLLLLLGYFIFTGRRHAA
ncbi:stage II sporulation protein M [Budviciaceae bacterium CWB-B4]|uniref:Stage II sporulation protein M n=1 Tax=Limnobaculum xujianqingii TaxID=2738837 RepID=A0A9D7AIN9_9GAMM|nr:stage II sporulation protein M [Limnobaculum xujianqingii]MBK5073599.1 stage II sporulation protein M [Limnobaculum xujianqingii]MBK5176670.1 stage II sporulation protein M [Limnobaculum xujianqingii]